MHLHELFTRLSPELPALLALTQRKPSLTSQAQVISWLETSGQIDQLYALSEAHGVSLLMYRGLTSIPDKPAALAKLSTRLAKELTEKAILYEFIYPGQLARLLAELGNEGVETIVVKGYAWGQVIYQQPALRPYNDFDLLVRESQLEIAEQVLTRLGYWPDETQFSRAWYRAHHHHLAPFVHQHYLPVEVHWGLVTPGSRIMVLVETVWKHAQRLEIHGVTTYTLSLEHALIYLCIHAISTHLFEMGLRGLCDVQELIAVHGDIVNWNTVFETSQQWRCERHVYLMLQLVSVAFGIPLPQTVLRRLREQDIAPSFLEYCVVNVLATAITGLPRSSGLAQVWQETNPFYRLRLAIRQFLPSRSTVAKQYDLNVDDPKVWLFYPCWQLLLLRRHFKTTWQLFQSNQETLEKARREATRRQLISWLEQ
jgi:hypothetical protein